MKSQILKINIILYIFLSSIQGLYAQVAINSTGSDPDASSIIDISSTDKGVLIPRMTTTQRTTIASPATGLLVYETTTKSFWFYNGAKWIQKLSKSNQTGTLSDNDNDTKVIVNPTTDNISFFQNNGTRFQLYENAANIPILHCNSNHAIIGQYAGKNNSQYHFNSFMGYSAGLTNVNGVSNVFFGTNAGLLSTNDQNVMIGFNTGNSITANRRNTIIGASAGNSFSNQNGVAFGYQAGNNASKGCFFGYQVGTNFSTEGVYIDNTSTNKPLIAGTTSEITINGGLILEGNLSIGSSSLAKTGFTGASGINIGTDGNVAIGTTNTTLNQFKVQGSVDVTGFIKSNGGYVVGANKYFRVIAGKVDEFGNLITSSTTVSDNGVNEDIESVTKTSEGQYTITLGTFSKVPAIIVTAEHGSGGSNRYAYIKSATTDEIKITIRNQNGSERNAAFNFILIGAYN